MSCDLALNEGKLASQAAINVVYVMLDRYEDELEETVSSLISRLSSRDTKNYALIGGVHLNLTL